MIVSSICFSETTTGPCSDPECDSINWGEIQRKLGADYAGISTNSDGRIIAISGRCVIDTLPEEVGNLPEMTEIWFHNGFLKYLPALIGNLTKLEYLDLSNNQLAELPQEIGRLVNLKEFYLDHNNLTTLPDSIVNIVKLVHRNDLPGYNFTIGWNHICSLPSAVARWVDTMYSGGGGTGAWEGMQCNDCPNGHEKCAASIKNQPAIPIRMPGRALPVIGSLFDLRGRRIGAVADRKDFSRFPQGCYIVRYGDKMPRFRRIAVP